MLTVDEALTLVLEHATVRRPARVPIGETLGLILAEDVASDVDSPPHDKAIVDGYAVVSSDLKEGGAELDVVEQITAGAVPTREVHAGQAALVMTGAPIPRGADAMIMIEHAQPIASGGGLGRVKFERTRASAGQNIVGRAASMRRGEIVLHHGCTIRAIEIGLMAEVGRTHVDVVPRPRVAVLPTGDELVPVDQKPRDGQIRNSNGPMLLACARRTGAETIDLGIGRDEVEALRTQIERGLAADILVISGGVSAGIFDLVPRVLDQLQVQQVFHKVRLKPGKPLWFGVVPGDEPKLVFGLPGNPVSSLVCFELFVRPAIAALSGRPASCLARISAPLGEAFEHRGERPTYHPARVLSRDGRTIVQNLPWKGSGDLRTLAEANALAHFPAGDASYAAGQTVEVVLL